MSGPKVAPYPFYYVVWFAPGTWPFHDGPAKGRASPPFGTYKAAKAFADTLDPALVPTIVAEVVS